MPATQALDRMAKRKTTQPKVYDRRSRDIPINAVVATVVVDDPYERGGKIETLRSLRDDILNYLHARKEIDDAQFHAGRRYERLLEIMDVSPLRAMDTTKEPVDGGGFNGDVFTNTQFNAVRDMEDVERILGIRPAKLVRSILQDRKKFKEIAPSIARHDVAYTRRLFFDCLDELAVFWNLAGR